MSRLVEAAAAAREACAAPARARSAWRCRNITSAGVARVVPQPPVSCRAATGAAMTASTTQRNPKRRMGRCSYSHTTDAALEFFDGLLHPLRLSNRRRFAILPCLRDALNRRRAARRVPAAEPPAPPGLHDPGRQPAGGARPPQAGQEVYAEAGKMVYKTANVHWDTRMSGNTLGEKLMGALRRTVTGESLFLTYFRADGAGEVGFAGNYPGRIQVFDLPRRTHPAGAARRLPVRAALRAVQRRAGEEAGRGLLRRRRLHPRKVHRTGRGVHPRGRRFRGVRPGRRAR